MAAYYDEFENKYYNPDDNDKKPGQNENWKMIQKGFSKISSTQLETSEGLTLGKGTDDEESLTASELEEIKKPAQLETSGALTLGKGTADEETLTAEELKGIKSGSTPKYNIISVNNLPTGTFPSKTLTIAPLNISENQLSAIKKFISDNLTDKTYSTCFLSLPDYKTGGNTSYTWDIEVVPLFKMGNLTKNAISKNQVVTLTDLAFGLYNTTGSDIVTSSPWGGSAIIANFTKWFEH